MAIKPDKYPEWARTDYVDPVTGGDNVIEPPPGKKDIGWLKEYPPSQYFNWLARLTYQWLEYLDSVSQSLPYAVAVRGTGDDYTIAVGDFTDYTEDMLFKCSVDVANISQATFDVNEIGPKSVKGGIRFRDIGGSELNTQEDYFMSYNIREDCLAIINKLTRDESVLALRFGDTGGTSSAYTLNPSPKITEYTDELLFTFNPNCKVSLVCVSSH